MYYNLIKKMNLALIKIYDDFTLLFVLNYKNYLGNPH